MKFEEIDRLFEEASKVLHMDSSHDAIRQKVQAAISAQHRIDNAGSDSGSYYDTPYVRDVFGTEDEGHVVHAKSGKMTLSKYKKNKTGGYDLSNHKPVKNAYVVADDEKKESMTVLLDGKEIQVSESSAAEVVMTEVIELQEASAKNGTAKVTLISAGKGSSGYYTEASLKKAAKDGIFAKGTQMFLNHQTKEERAARPEGDITKLAATLTSNAEYVEGAAGKPGRLVAPANIYPEYRDFIAARKDDIGVSIRVGAEPTNKLQEGVPLVENMVYALSADFVTKAGRGGKIEELYESFRGEPGQRQPAAGEDTMTENEQKQFTTLQESLAVEKTRNDRMAERLTTIEASSLVSEALRTSNLPARGQDRVRTQVLATLPLTAEKTLDVTKLQEAITKAVKEETEYLQEAGGMPRPQIVRHLGSTNVRLHDEAGNPRDEATILQEADTEFENHIASITGQKPKEKTA